MQGRQLGSRAEGVRGCSRHHGTCRLRAECTGLCQLRASVARNARRPRPRPLLHPPSAQLRPGPHPPPGATPKARNIAVLLRRGGWEDGGGGLRIRENAAVTVPTAWVTLPQAAAGTPEPFGLTTRLSSVLSYEGKCQGVFLQAPVQ